ncbi:MAG TPA: S8 family serine peptidase [Chryseolinea sp.]
MGWSKVGVTIVFVTGAIISVAQENRYMVFFKDKAASSFSTSQPLEFLSQRAVDRRVRQGISVNEQDIPVNENYVEAVSEAGANVFFRTRWMNGVLVQCDASLIPTLEDLSFVDRVEFVAPNKKLLPNGRSKAHQRTKGAKLAGKTQIQLEMIGLDEMQSAGYKGETIYIGIFDSGFQGVDGALPFQHIFTEGRIDVGLSKDFVFNSDDVFQYDEHGTEVFSVIAAFQDGNFIGGSYEANYQLYVTEDVNTEYRIEEYNWVFAAERADSSGVDVINSSLGYYDFDDTSMNYSKNEMNGETTVITRAAQFATDRGIVVVCSAGNEGTLPWQTITAPADARDVLAVASVNSVGQRSTTSSVGPSADGRIKPDVAALGVNTSVIKPDGSAGSASGTSLASPLVASLVAGVWQRYPQLTNKEVVEAVRRSASQAESPDFLIGYGIPNFMAVVNYLDERPQDNPFEVYPNPVLADTLTIRPFDPGQITSCRVEILSSQGQLVHSTEAEFSWLNRTYTANLSQFAAGMYYLRILWGEKRYTFKLVKA